MTINWENTKTYKGERNRNEKNSNITINIIVYSLNSSNFFSKFIGVRVRTRKS